MNRLRGFKLVFTIVAINICTLVYPLNGQNEWLPWRALSKAEVVALLQEAAPKLIGGSALPDDDHRTLKFQAVIDTFHDTLGSSYPGAPAPRLMILNSISDQIFTISKPFCFPVYITWNNNSLPKAGLLSSAATGMEINAVLPSSESCEYISSLTIDQKIAIMQQALPFADDCLTVKTGTFIKLHVDIKPSCAVEYEKTHKDSLLSDFSSAGHFSTAYPINWVFVTTKALESMPDELITARLAHELAHYYQAHSSTGKGFDYSYRIDLDNYRHREAIKPNDPLVDLANAVKLINPSSFAPYSEERSMLIRAYDEDLGYFTAEQHADEIALTYLQAIDQDPRLLIEALFASLRENPSHSGYPLPPRINPSFLTCLKLYQEGFTTKVGVGVYHHQHHTECFRIFNLYKLIYH